MINFVVRPYLRFILLTSAIAIALHSGFAAAQVKPRLSIATGGTGGVY